MKTIFVIFLALYAFQINYTQNLIKNPSLENYVSCPTSGGQLFKCINWFGNSVEFFHSCSPFNGLKTPENSFGFQVPKSGEAYGGFHPVIKIQNIYYGSEFAGTKLNEQLTKKFYCGGYFVALTNGSTKATDAFQMYFTHDSLVNSMQWQENRPWPAQITYKGGFVTDTLDWTKIEGAFLADGNERFVQIGCFLDSLSINGISVPFDSLNLGPPFGANYLTYYYFDDLYLYELNKLPQAQNHAYNCAANTVTLKTDTGFNFRWYYLPDTINVLSTADTFLVDASTAKNVLLRATLCSTEFTDTVAVPKLDCTGIENNALAQGAALFPNPAGSVATFTLQGTPPPGTTLHLTDLNGRELRSYAVQGKTTELHLQGLSAGVYVLSYRYKQNVIWKGKLAVMK